MILSKHIIRRTGMEFSLGWRLLMIRVIALLLQGVVHGSADESEYRLTRHLMTDYDASVRPVENSSLPLKVSISIALHNIIDVDEKNQILTTNCWMSYTWMDHHLKWNASEFAGIKVVRIPHKQVWTPDIILYDNADSQYSRAVISTNVIVYSDGKMLLLSHGIFHSTCDINVEYFPFDVQSCQMKWASWSYDGNQIDLELIREHGDVSNYQPNGEFDLISYEAERHEKIYTCCPEPYPDITYTIRIRRRPLFYVFNLILPCMLINAIALLVFYVPAESGEKVTLGISALLSTTVFLMTIRESLPPTEKTPLISVYYGVSICLVSFACGLSVISLNVYHRGVHGIRVPMWVKRLVLGPLARIVFMDCNVLEAPNSPHQSVPGPRREFQEEARAANRQIDTSFSKSDNRAQNNDHESSDSNLSPFFAPCRKRRDSISISQDRAESLEGQFLGTLQKINRALERNESRLMDRERCEGAAREWKQVALVCDRVLLWIFLFTTAVATTAILTSSPYGP
ncbi:neuronal acetylcholine receptor subunit alpha-10-like [Neocloeon triangulifer]|uniref:neuronal acetylcholine receptor subunit alpha-10-like n=1 Tax=Neocloeon triangulifer TaxID=2078957 RepID=UPI00286F8805|nr:neuronal acetylcholine receptor subunit alpha-10-like [Neocloeon triangulifer]